jgi:hypothetical protein
MPAPVPLRHFKDEAISTNAFAGFFACKVALAARRHAEVARKVE